jgi:hypothetical protein
MTSSYRISLSVHYSTLFSSGLQYYRNSLQGDLISGLNRNCGLMLGDILVKFQNYMELVCVEIRLLSFTFCGNFNYPERKL